MNCKSAKGLTRLSFLAALVFSGSVKAQLLQALFPTQEKDEAKISQDKGQFSQADFQKLVAGSTEDFFKDMDNGVTLPQNAENLQKELNVYVPGITKEDAVKRMARGRNNWIVWTGGNDRFWTHLGRSTFGGLDFLKTISTHAAVPQSRSNRWQTLGLVNEPCFKQASGPRADRWGLWLDERIVSADCPADPFEDASKYPGVKIGARGTALMYKGQKKNLEVGSFYGYPTGIVGLRLFPNPDFDQKAADNWDPEKFYNDANYYNNPNTIKPYRVGMACAFCHVGPNPSNPPVDFNNPKWANLSSSPGAQYFWVDRIFYWDWAKGKDSFVFQLLHTSRPGSLDTSLVSSDQINNPRTMNAVYDLPSRIAAGLKFNALEDLTGEETRNVQFSKLNTGAVPANSVLRTMSKANGVQVISPRVLKDGSDSVGALGALNRVYVNIGLFGEEWVKHFIPLVGGPNVTPFPIKMAEQNSLYWQANVQQTPDLALFFLGSAKPDKLAAAPGGSAYLQDIESPQVNLGKKVYAENCARCHSSKLPEKAYSFFNNPANPKMCLNGNYLNCWNAFWNYSKTPEFKTEMTKLVSQKDFLDHNFLSTDLRVPVTLTDSQLCSPIATNALKGDIWDNFTSTTYKTLPSVGKASVSYPLDASNTLQGEVVTIPGGGRGFIRPPSLISVWSTAPFLQNNALGSFDDRGSVEGRMKSFNDSITKLLYPEKRADPSKQNEAYGTRNVYFSTRWGDQLPGIIDVTTQDSYLKIPRGYLPNFLFDIIRKVQGETEIGKKDFVKSGISYAALGNYDDTKPEVKMKKGKKSKREVANVAMEWTATVNPEEMADFIFIGPIPAGVPVNMISSLNLRIGILDTLTISNAVIQLTRAGIHIHSSGLTGTAARDYFMQTAAKALIAASSCKDYVVSRGHYFGTQFGPEAKEGSMRGLSPDEKTALIEYLKHM